MKTPRPPEYPRDASPELRLEPNGDGRWLYKIFIGGQPWGGGVRATRALAARAGAAAKLRARYYLERQRQKRAPETPSDSLSRRGR